MSPSYANAQSEAVPRTVNTVNWRSSLASLCARLEAPIAFDNRYARDEPLRTLLESMMHALCEPFPHPKALRDTPFSLLRGLHWQLADYADKPLELLGSVLQAMVCGGGRGRE